MAETIQVGNVPYKYDRNTGTAYRMDGAPITATEQASVDRILTSDQPVGFGTFSTDSPTPIEMLNAPIEASQQAQDAKVTAQEDLVFNMDPKKTTFAERAAERKRLLELNQLPSVTAEDVGAPESLVTQKEVDDLSEDRRTGASAQEQNQIEADAITQNDADAMDLEDAGSKGPSNLIDITKVVTAIDNNESTSDALVGGATGTNQNLTPKESVKAYQAIFKEMLGVDDEDKEKEKYHQMAMIGFAIAAGQDPNALSNVAGGLLEGTKLARKDRKDRKALQAKVDMAAFNAAREDTQRSEDLANKITLANIRADGSGTSMRNFKSPIDAIQYEANLVSTEVENGTLELKPGQSVQSVAIDRVIPLYTSMGIDMSSFKSLGSPSSSGSTSQLSTAADTEAAAKAAGKKEFVWNGTRYPVR